MTESFRYQMAGAPISTEGMHALAPGNLPQDGGAVAQVTNVGVTGISFGGGGPNDGARAVMLAVSTLEGTWGADATDATPLVHGFHHLCLPEEQAMVLLGVLAIWATDQNLA